MGDSKPGNVAPIVVTGIIMGTLALTTPFVFSRSPLPYMATPKSKLRRALSWVKDQNAGRFVDLGSGDGEAIIQAVSLGFKSSIGIELNRTLWAISRIRLFRELKISGKKQQHACIYLGNLFNQSLKDADAVMIFGVTPLMEQISRKLRAECRPGTFILSYRFLLPLAVTPRIPGEMGSIGHNYSNVEVASAETTQASTPDSRLLHATVVYDEDEMRIYKVVGSSISR